MGPPPRRPSPEKAVAEPPRSRATVSEAARPESRPRRLTSRRARAQDARPPPGICFPPPARWASGPQRGGLRRPPGPEAGCAEAHAMAGRGEQDAGYRAATQAPSSPSPLLTGGSARTDAVEAAVPALWPGGPVETDTDTLSPALVTARGQEPEPRSPPASITAHTQRRSVQTKKIQNGKRLPPPSKGEQGTRAPRARHRHTQPCAGQAHPDHRRTDARGPGLPSQPATQPLRAARPPAGMGGERAGVQEEEVRKEVGVGEGRRGSKNPPPGF